MRHETPTIEQCKTWMDQYEMLDNIRAHSFLVARVAETLVNNLARTGKVTALPDLDMVVAGALLHDIAKTKCIKTGCHHALVGQQICLELGYPLIGELVAEHVVLNDFTLDLYKAGAFGAKEIIFYADKRVLHDQVVPLSSRLSYIVQRYGNGDPSKEKLIRKNFSLTIELEEYLFCYLDFPKDALNKKLENVILATGDG